MTQYAQVNPEIISWALDRARLSVDAVAQKLHVNPDRVSEWETGVRRPTFKQAMNFANKVYLPFGYLFLAQPPKDQLQIPDLRTVGSEPLQEPSLALLDTVRSVLQKQVWYQEYVIDQGEGPLPFVGAFTTQTPVRQLVADMQRRLGVDDIDPHGLRWDEYQAAIVSRAETMGILVIRSGIVGNNTHRPLDVQEFRGFAIADAWAPVVFINGKDAPTARLFTLIHELAHIWIGSSGVSSVGISGERGGERYCNQVAAEFLAPEKRFLQLWKTGDWEANLPELSRQFHVSQMVIARRALTLGKIDEATYRNHYLNELKRFNEATGGGGSFYRNAKTKNSERFSRAVTAEALSGHILLRDAGKLLGISPGKIAQYAKELNR
ncbi:XRE family transcriptional regulator [bacterium endosymbiont of Escarpia laminata]|nr:MAG: XRE family transcriptional regulator [bacterium endosymbiont of Escarpia laminata]